VAEGRVLSISSISLPGFLGRRYYDLEATLFVMGMFSEQRIVDGFELQLLGEWNAEYPPISVDSKFDRKMEWEISEKYTREQIARSIKRRGLAVLSVHANRDVGVCLCSPSEELVHRGQQHMENALHLAEMVGAGVCVFHLWDPWIEDIDFGRLYGTFMEVARKHPGVRAAVENIPTHQRRLSPYQLLQEYEWVTVDTKWATLYDELEAFRRLKERIVDVHLRGTLRRGSWRFEGSSNSFDAVLETVMRGWNYEGLLTVEPEEELGGLQWKELVHGFSLLKRTTEIL